MPRLILKARRHDIRKKACIKSPIAATSLADDMSAVTTSILIVGALLLVALAVVYFGLVRRRRELVTS